MTNRNTRSGKLAFLLIALVVLAGFQPGPAKTQDIEQLRLAAVQGYSIAQYKHGVMYDDLNPSSVHSLVIRHSNIE